jgi:transposase
MLFGKRIIGLDGCELVSATEFTSTLFAKAVLTCPQVCPRCGSGEHRIKSTERRLIRHAAFDARVLFVEVLVRKRLCTCCNRYFRERIPGVKPRARASESFKNHTFTLHEAGSSCKTLGKMLRVSADSVSRWVEERLDKRLSESENRRKVCPTQLGIDEHFFTKKRGFATTLVDLKRKQVFDVVLGRSEKSLEGYLSKLAGREKVTVVVMDLSDTYRHIVQSFFPNAKIIADRFHVIRLVFQHFQKLWHQLDPQVKWKRGLRKLFRMHPQNLDPMQTLKLQSYLNENPAIQAIYEKRNEVSSLLLKRDQKGFQIGKNVGHFFSLTNELNDVGFASLKTLAETLVSWQAEIGRMWRISRNNGITEGFHNKMEVISRRAYGYRNFNNYRKRVLATSGWDGILAPRRRQRFDKLQV